VNHYTTLGLQVGAEPAEIRRAYIKLAQAHHTDAGGAGTDGEAIRAINAAYSVLKDAAKRAEHDKTLWLLASRCTVCKGKGELFSQVGFFSRSTTCQACQGRGRQVPT
jgi:DnaJ-class molecular chaperone